MEKECTAQFSLTYLYFNMFCLPLKVNRTSQWNRNDWMSSVYSDVPKLLCKPSLYLTIVLKGCLIIEQFITLEVCCTKHITSLFIPTLVSGVQAQAGTGDPGTEGAAYSSQQSTRPLSAPQCDQWTFAPALIWCRTLWPHSLTVHLCFSPMTDHPPSDWHLSPYRLTSGLHLVDIRVT